jgi:uncharacterized protein YkwD
MLELLNMARTNPSETAQWVAQKIASDSNVQQTLNYFNVNPAQVEQAIASTPAQPPLGWNDQLAAAAQAHSQDMMTNGFQSHTGSDGSSPADRMTSAGYSNASAEAENAFAYASSVDEAMEAFLLDWGVSGDGHRMNIQQPGATGSNVYREVGIGIVQSTNPKMGPLVITQDFGARNAAQAELLGVAYNDSNGNNMYDPGEGQGNVNISATNLANGQTTNVQTWNSGGYQMSLNPGQYQVTASVGNQVVRSQTVNIGTDNVEVDFNLSQPWQGTAPAPAIRAAALAVQAAQPTPAPAPAPTPQPQPVVIPTVTIQQPTVTSTPTPPANPLSNFNPSWITNWVSWNN